jgi:hypothetical protein
VNYPSTASHPLAGLRQGGKTVEKRHRVVRRAGTVIEVACGISANPYYSVQRFLRTKIASNNRASVIGIKALLLKQMAQNLEQQWTEEREYTTHVVMGARAEVAFPEFIAEAWETAD